MKQWILLLIIVVLVGMMGLVGGWNLHKNLRPCPAPIHDSIFVWDTVEKVITNTVKILVPDTILYPDSIIVPIDSSKIIDIFKDYYAKKVFNRHWEDSAVYVSLRDTTNQNSLFEGEFKYKYKLPTTIINNTNYFSTYYSYVNVGLSCLLTDPKYTSIDISYQNEKISAGAFYMPYQNGFGLRVSAVVFKLKSTE